MTTTKQTAESEPQPEGPVDCCDSCLTEAYDLGFMDAETQDYAMREAGEVLPDHLCDAKEEPEYYPRGCGCGCYRERPAP